MPALKADSAAYGEKGLEADFGKVYETDSKVIPYRVHTIRGAAAVGLLHQTGGGGGGVGPLPPEDLCLM